MIEEALIRKMLSELKDIQALSSERLLQQKIDLLIKYMENIVKYKNDEPFEDTIYKKMKEVRLDNPELNSKLYILYRKLSDGKSLKKMQEFYMMCILKVKFMIN